MEEPTCTKSRRRKKFKHTGGNKAFLSLFPPRSFSFNFGKFSSAFHCRSYETRKAILCTGYNCRVLLVATLTHQCTLDRPPVDLFFRVCFCSAQRVDSVTGGQRKGLNDACALTNFNLAGGNFSKREMRANLEFLIMMNRVLQWTPVK